MNNDVNDNFEEMELLDNEIEKIEECKDIVNDNYMVCSKFQNTKQLTKDFFLYLMIAISGLAVLNIDLILILISVFTCCSIPVVILFDKAYKSVKKFDSSIPCFGRKGRKYVERLEKKQQFLDEYLEEKQLEKEELNKKFKIYVDDGHISLEDINEVIDKSKEEDFYFDEIWDNEIGNDIDYTENSKKLLKKYNI